MMSWAAQTLLAGHMRPAGRVFETPVVEDAIILFKFGIGNFFELWVYKISEVG